MKLFLLLLFISFNAIAGLPPTTSQGNGDSSDVTTYKFRFPNITVTHSGTLATFNTVNVAGGGTGATSLTANNIILGNGTSPVQFVAPGTSGNVLTSNGTTWTSSVATITDGVKTPASGKPVMYSALISSASVVSNEYGDLFNGNCSGTTPAVCTFTSGIFSGTPNCVASPATNASRLNITGLTSTTLTLQAENSAGAAVASSYLVICHGVSP